MRWRLRNGCAATLDAAVGREAIRREPIRNGRGRPKFSYWLTDRNTSNRLEFRRLGDRLMGEVRQNGDANTDGDAAADRQGLGGRLRDQNPGRYPVERMQSLAICWPNGESRIAGEYDQRRLLTPTPALPKLAEQDQGICSVERMMSPSCSAGRGAGGMRVQGGGSVGSKRADSSVYLAVRRVSSREL